MTLCRNAVRLALVAGLSAALLLPHGAADAAAGAAAASNRSVAFARSPGFAGIADSLRIDAPVLLHGRLGAVGGQALDGAQVLLSAWPSRETVRALPKGAEFYIVPIARTTAGRDGSFELRSALTPLLGSLIGRDGLDLEVHVIHGGRQYDYLTNVLPVRQVGAWVRAIADTTLAATQGAGERNRLDIALDPATGEKLSPALLRAATLRASAPDPEPFKNEPMFPGRYCTRYKKIDFKRTFETVATAHVKDGVSATAHYAKGAVTDSSAGLSLDGIGFSIAGSRSHESTIGVVYPELKSKRKGWSSGQYAAEVEHNVVERRCLSDNGYSNSGKYRSTYKTVPGRTVGAKPMPATARPWDCQIGNRGSGTGTMTADTKKAHTYEGAFNFSPLGLATFTGRALSGYSEAVKLEFHYEKSGDGWWCGHTGSPDTDGQMIQGYVR
ncbi:MAG: hypothetical protein ACT4QG_16075 [Sporichthyaceae bacterium]